MDLDGLNKEIHNDCRKKDIDKLKQYFTPGEISELISYCSFISASQRFEAVLDLEPALTYKLSKNKYLL